MKKCLSLFCCLMVLSIVGTVQAQSLSRPLNYRSSAVFSPALFSSDLWNAPRRVRADSIARTSAGVKNPQARQTLLLRYESGVIKLNEEQKKILMRVVESINSGKFRKVYLVIATTDWSVSRGRLSTIVEFIRQNVLGSTPSISYQIISPNLVMDANDNTVKIIESN